MILRNTVLAGSDIYSKKEHVMFCKYIRMINILAPFTLLYIERATYIVTSITKEVGKELPLTELPILFAAF